MVFQRGDRSTDFVAITTVQSLRRHCPISPTQLSNFSGSGCPTSPTYSLTIVARIANSLSVAKVKAAPPQRSAIVNTIEGNGKIAANSAVEVSLPPQIEIVTFEVEQGQSITKGQPIASFKIESIRPCIFDLDYERQRLILDIEAMGAPTNKAAQNAVDEAIKNLMEANNNFQQVMVDTEKNNQRARQDYSLTMSEWRSLLNSEDADGVSSLGFKSLEGKMSKLATQISKLRVESNIVLTQYYESFRSLDSSMASPNNISDRLSKQLHTIEEEMKKLEKEYTKLSDDYNDFLDYSGSDESMSNQIKNQRREVISQRRIMDDILLESERNVDKAEKKLENMENELGKAKEEVVRNSFEQLQTKKSESLEMQSAKNKISKLTTQITQLESLEKDAGILLSPFDGVLISYSEEDKITFNFSDSEANYIFSANMQSEYADLLTASTNVELKAAGKSYDQAIESLGIIDDNGAIQITGSIPSNVFKHGQRVSVNAEIKSQIYDTCVPLNALRSDEDGDFIFVVATKKGIMGEELTAKRSSIEVLQVGDSKAAIRGVVKSEDLIIYNTNRMLNEGDRIRLEK